MPDDRPFEVEFIFTIREQCIHRCDLIANEDTEDERRIVLQAPSDVHVNSVQGDCWFSVSVLEFRGCDVVFGLLFQELSSNPSRRREGFLEQFWLLSRLGFRPTESAGDLSLIAQIMERIACCPEAPHVTECLELIDWFKTS
ncbi:MAG: hypothetical protein AAGJ83_16300 [Planctomycetota bacterium]